MNERGYLQHTRIESQVECGNLARIVPFSVVISLREMELAENHLAERDHYTIE